MRNTFKILFYIKRTSLLRNGHAPIMGRITINGQRAQLSTHLSIPAELWNARMGCATGSSRLADEVNARLKDIRFQINRCYDALFFNRQSVTPQKVRQLFLGGENRTKGVVCFFKAHNKEFAQMVGINRAPSTYYKYRCVCTHLETFIRSHYGCSDLGFAQLDREFIIGFHQYIANRKSHKTNTVWIYLIAFKHVLMIARSQGLIEQDLFANYKLHSEYIPRDYLSMEELREIVGLELKDATLRLVRDAFLFSCFTGLSYVDVKSLTATNILNSGGKLWVQTKRRKTGAAVQIRLFELPKNILMKYMPRSKEQFIFPLPGNGWCNSCLERIMYQIGVDRRITFHSARHTFATTITLSQGMAIETISRLLGHRDIRTTQIYATVTHSRMALEMDHLSRIIDPMCPCVDGGATER